MFIKRKRSVCLLLVFIFSVSIILSQLWMLMTRFDVSVSSNLNNIKDVDESSQHLSILTNISKIMNKYRNLVDDSANENSFRRPDYRDRVADEELRNKFNHRNNNIGLDVVISEETLSARKIIVSQASFIDPIVEFKIENSPRIEKTQNDMRNSDIDTNMSLRNNNISLTKKRISNEYRDNINGTVNLNYPSSDFLKHSRTSTMTVRLIAPEYEKKIELLKSKHETKKLPHELIYNETIHSENTFENQDLHWPQKESSESDNVHTLNISRDDFAAADDLTIRDDINQIPKFDVMTSSSNSANFARIENNNSNDQHFAEENFGAVSNSEPHFPLPTKSTHEFVDDTDSRKSNNNVPSSLFNVPNSPGINVVAMSLYGADVRYTMGALRNAEIIRRNFPSWTLRIYTESAASSPRHGLVPVNVIRSLRHLGAEIQYMMPEQDFIPPMMWRFLVADDLSVDRFIVRDTDSRLTARDAAAVAAWIRSDKPFHSIRDHPSHAAYAVSGGLWGGKTTELRDILRRSWIDVMRGLAGDYFRDMSFLNDIIWPRVKAHAYCSDSVSCDRWPNSFPFPVRRRGTEHVGEVYDEHDVGREGDVRILRAAGENVRCLPDVQ